MKLKYNKLKVSCETNNKQEVIKHYRNKDDDKYRKVPTILSFWDNSFYRYKRSPSKLCFAKSIQKSSAVCRKGITMFKY